MCALKAVDVFMPRSAEVNPVLYIPRPELETELKEALSETQHILIHGESGNGKSWLYKRVFRDEKVFHVVVNLVQASRLGSLNAAFRDVLERLEGGSVEQREIIKTAKLSPYNIGFEGAEKQVVRLGQKEPYEALLNWVSRKSAKRHVIILDNFEQISGNSALCKEVSDCVILLDDPTYSKYNVKLCIVGVPRDIDDILAAHGNVATVSSRLREISEVERMTNREAELLMQIGLERLLKIEIQFDKDDFYKKVLWLQIELHLSYRSLGFVWHEKLNAISKNLDRCSGNALLSFGQKGL